MVEIENHEELMRVEERFLTSRGLVIDYPKVYRENLEYRIDLAYRAEMYRDWETDRKSTRLNSSHSAKSRMPSSA